MKNMTLAELNEKCKDCPVRRSEYEIGGKKYIVTSHFVGNKDLDKVLYDIAFRRACEETLKEISA